MLPGDLDDRVGVVVRAGVVLRQRLLDRLRLAEHAEVHPRLGDVAAVEVESADVPAGVADGLLVGVVGVGRQVGRRPGRERGDAEFDPLPHEQGVEEVLEVLGRAELVAQAVDGGERAGGRPGRRGGGRTRRGRGLGRAGRRWFHADMVSQPDPLPRVGFARFLFRPRPGVAIPPAPSVARRRRMPTRFVPPAALVVLAGALVALAPAAGAESIHRDGFAGRRPVVRPRRRQRQVRGEGPQDLRPSTPRPARPPSTSRSRPTRRPGPPRREFVHYYYDTPPAPVTDRLTASVWVKAIRPGVQVKARVVFPKEKDPRNPDAPLTTLVAGDDLREASGSGSSSGSGTCRRRCAKHLPVLHARLGRAVDPTDAYVDRLVLNVYAGPGVTEVWIDDLEIGPVRTDVPRRSRGRPGTGRDRGPTPRPAAAGRVLRRPDPGRGDDGIAVLHARHPPHAAPR